MYKLPFQDYIDANEGRFLSIQRDLNVITNILETVDGLRLHIFMRQN